MTWPHSPWKLVPLLQGEESPVQLRAPPLQGWVRMAAWGRRVPSQYCLPEQGRDPRDPSPAPRSTIGTRRSLAPKCHIVVSFCIKNRIKKDCYLSQPQDWHPLHTQEKQAHRKISKFTSSRIGKAEPSAHPHPPVENSLHPNPVTLSALILEAMLQLEGGAHGGGQRC